MTATISPIHAVTISTGDLAATRALFTKMLGMETITEWPLDATTARLWGLPENTQAQCCWLQTPGAAHGALRLVQFNPTPSSIVAPRSYDFGYIKNLDFFTDDVAAQYERFTAAGYRFLAPPVTYPLSWSAAMTATEAHLPIADGVKLAFAQLSAAPRRAFGESSRAVPFTEIAAATQIVADYESAVNFYCTVFDCVPATPALTDEPAFIAALKLPIGTRLRMSFIGPPQAIGGKLGIVAYEGPNLGDAQSVSAQRRPPNRGAIALSFLCDNVDFRYALAGAHGATALCPPQMMTLPPFGPPLRMTRAASLLSPDGVLLELLEPLAAEPEFIPALTAADLPDGGMMRVTTPRLGHVLLYRSRAQVFAWPDRCPHLHAPLSQGQLHDGVVTCPWHGWQMSLATGKVIGCSAGIRPLRAQTAAGLIYLSET